MFFRFPPDARWNPERSVVEFGIGVGEYEGVVRVSRRVFQILLPETPTPERCLKAYRSGLIVSNIGQVRALPPLMATGCRFVETTVDHPLSLCVKD